LFAGISGAVNREIQNDQNFTLNFVSASCWPWLPEKLPDEPPTAQFTSNVINSNMNHFQTKKNCRRAISRFYCQDTMKEKKPKIIILTGTTAVGKSYIASKMAHLLNGELVSADSVKV
jgi:hypothetical protein